MYSKVVHYPQSFLMQPHIWWNYLAPPPCRITAIAAALVVPTPPLSLPPTLPISVLPHNKSNLPYPFPSSPTIKVTWYSYQLNNTQLVWKKGLFFFFKEALRFISLILSVWFLFNFLFRLSLFLTLPHFLCYDYNQVFNTLVYYFPQRKIIKVWSRQKCIREKLNRKPNVWEILVIQLFKPAYFMDVLRLIFPVWN